MYDIVQLEASPADKKLARLRGEFPPDYLSRLVSGSNDSEGARARFRERGVEAQRAAPWRVRAHRFVLL